MKQVARRILSASAVVFGISSPQIAAFGLTISRGASFGRRTASTRWGSALATDSDAEEKQDLTITKLTVPGSDKGTTQRVTIIGTAHLSSASNEQVIRVINEVRPDVVTVELDRKRLKRAKLENIEDLGMEVVTSEDIIPPSTMENNSGKNQGWLAAPSKLMQNLFLNVFTQIARKLLTGMYDDLSVSINGKDGQEIGEFAISGGEFRAAVLTARGIDECKRIVLADRDSLITIRRAAELAIDSGEPLQVLQRLLQANREEIGKVEAAWRKKWKEEHADDDISESEMNVMLIETLKEDDAFRERLFQRLEQEVPEFTTAFLKERDYIMAQSIFREISNGASHVVAVVGLAHAPGMTALLKEAWNKTK